MSEQEFLKAMKEDILDIEDEITLETELLDFAEWDSLGVVDFIAMANISCGKKIKRADVADAQTFGDLYNLLK